MQELVDDFRPRQRRWTADRYATLVMDDQALRLLGSAALARAARGERGRRRRCRCSSCFGLGGVAGGVRARAEPRRASTAWRTRRITAPLHAHRASTRIVSGWFERYARTFAGTIAGGTSEIQRNIIAQRVLGLPRS